MQQVRVLAPKCISPWTDGAHRCSGALGGRVSERARKLRPGATALASSYRRGVLRRSALASGRGGGAPFGGGLLGDRRGVLRRSALASGRGGGAPFGGGLLGDRRGVLRRSALASGRGGGAPFGGGLLGDRRGVLRRLRLTAIVALAA